MTPPAAPPNPAQIEVDYPPQLSRGLIFVKWLLVIPHFLVIVVLGLIADIVLIISWFAVLFTGRFPRGLFDYMTGFYRWTYRATAYGVLLLTDQYPPFSLEDDPAYPVRLQFAYPERIPRWQPLVGWLLVIPAYICAYVLILITYLVVFIAWFAILFTGRYPEGLFDIVVIVLRWQVRVTTYMFWMNPEYPPFVWA
jgi:hypothetical protein